MKRMPVISGLGWSRCSTAEVGNLSDRWDQPFDYEEGWRAGSSLNSDEG